MTNESRRAFDAEWQKYTPEDDKPYSKIIAEHFWQSSEARILALLDSGEMAVIIAQAIYDNSSFDFKEQAIAALEAIKQRIGE